MNSKIGFIIIILTLSLALCGCTATSGENVAFGTRYKLTVSGNGAAKAIDEGEALLRELENQISTNIETSDVAKINNSQVNQPVSVGEHTAELFLLSTIYSERTKNAFNPSIFPLVELWGFAPSNYLPDSVSSIPSNETVSEVLSHCSMDFFIYDAENRTITKTDAKAKLDFGGIAKGYAADLLTKLYKDKKQAFVDVGGTIKASGEEKNIGIQHPRKSGNLFGTVKIDGEAIATSGDYERKYYFENKLYHHIIDRVGKPANLSEEEPVISATVVGESGALCDALSTALFVLTREEASELFKTLPYSALIITEKGYYSLGNKEFTVDATEFEKI